MFILKWLLGKKSPAVGETDSLGRTRLHKLAEGPYVDLDQIPVLIAQGEDINAQDINGQTPSHLILQHYSVGYSPEICFKLIEAGANPNIPDNDGLTLFHILAKQDLSAGNWKGFNQVFIQFMERGADPIAEDKNGRTPLFYAAKADNLRLVIFLLNVPSVRNHPQVNAHLAVSNNKIRSEADRFLTEQAKPITPIAEKKKVTKKTITVVAEDAPARNLRSRDKAKAKS